MAMISFGEQCSSRSSAKKMTNKDEEEHLKKMQNFYSRMPPPEVAPLPPPPRRLNRNERRCRYTSYRISTNTVPDFQYLQFFVGQ